VARYFMHLRNGTDELLDSEGVELVGLEAVRQNVMTAARDILGGDLRAGVMDLRYRIDAENEGGAIVYTLPFKQAFSIIPEAA
jgi:hypothetical protein